MTCCFSVGHFHIYLPLAGYICRWQTMFATQAIQKLLFQHKFMLPTKL